MSPAVAPLVSHPKDGLESSTRAVDAAFVENRHWGHPIGARRMSGARYQETTMNGRGLLVRSAAALLSAAALAAPAAAEPDAAKTLAYETVDGNAEQIATVGDSVYYFAELGMQEFES